MQKNFNMRKIIHSVEKELNLKIQKSEAIPVFFPEGFGFKYSVKSTNIRRFGLL